VQVLTRADGTHKPIKDRMWKAQMEERQKDVAYGITSAQLRIIKEPLCYQFSVAHSLSLTTTKTPSSLVLVTHEVTSGTHDLREEPLVTIPHEEHLEL
jgi:hypothetical protein